MNTRSKFAVPSLAAASLLLLTSCGDDVEDVPEFSEIEENIITSMESAESVSITMSAGIGGGVPVDMPFAGPDGEMMTFEGAIDGSSMALSIGASEEPMMIVLDEEVLMNLNFIFTMMEQEIGIQFTDNEDAMFGVPEDLRNSWIDLSEEMAGEQEEMNLSVFFEEMRSAWEDSSADGEASGPTGGVYEERDGEDVWVYKSADENEDVEIVVEADRDQPRILSITADDGVMTFSNWDDVDLPERPDEDQIRTEQEMERMLEEVFGGMMF